MEILHTCQIRVDGQVQDKLVGDVITLEVAERDEEPSSFALKIAIYLKGDGTWTRVDEPSGASGGFLPWQRITVSLGSGGNGDVLIDGYVAGVAPHIGVTETESYLLVWGYDASYAMNVEEKVVAWPDQKYSDVARKIFADHGLATEIVDTKIVYATDDNLLMQRGTDWQFLKRLADRVGYELFVRGAKGYFRPPDLSRTPQKDLAACFGQERTNLLWFEPRVTADQPEMVSMARANPIDKIVEKIDVSASPFKPLGAKNSKALRAGRSAAGTPSLRVEPKPLSNAQAMKALATGIRGDVDWNVGGEGEIDGVRYGQALRAHETVIIKGLGRTFSGIYYVTEVIHQLTESTYTQRFKAIRNGVGLTGREQFHADGGSSGSRVQVSSSGRVVSP